MLELSHAPLSSAQERNHHRKMPCQLSHDLHLHRYLNILLYHLVAVKPASFMAFWDLTDTVKVRSRKFPSDYILSNSYKGKDVRL